MHRNTNGLKPENLKQHIYIYIYVLSSLLKQHMMDHNNRNKIK